MLLDPIVRPRLRQPAARVTAAFLVLIGGVSANAETLREVERAVARSIKALESIEQSSFTLHKTAIPQLDIQLPGKMETATLEYVPKESNGRLFYLTKAHGIEVAISPAAKADTGFLGDQPVAFSISFKHQRQGMIASFDPAGGCEASVGREIPELFDYFTADWASGGLRNDWNSAEDLDEMDLFRNRQLIRRIHEVTDKPVWVKPNETYSAGIVLNSFNSYMFWTAENGPAKDLNLGGGSGVEEAIIGIKKLQVRNNMEAINRHMAWTTDEISSSSFLALTCSFVFAKEEDFDAIENLETSDQIYVGFSDEPAEHIKEEFSFSFLYRLAFAE